MRDRIGQAVVLHGTAGNAKAGAVLLVDGSPIYLEGLASWPEGWSGASVRVMGTLRERKMIPDPVNEKGEIAQGAWGTQLVIETPKWERR